MTYLLASILGTQVIIAEVQSLGMPITLRDRLLSTGRDILGLLISYLPALLLVMAPALALAALIGSRLSRWRALIYPLCAALSVWGLHLGLRELLDFNLLAAARSDLGLALQVGAAWVGGYCHYMFLGLARR